MANLSEYPHFKGGDVHILAPTGDAWRLHAYVLRGHSTAFDNLISQNPARHLTKKQKEDGKTILWRFHMTPTNDPRYVTFEFVPASTNRAATFPFSLHAVQKPTEYLHMYDNLFRCLYNMDPIFHPSNERLVHDAIGLLHAAEGIGAVSSVRRDIETHLLRTGNYLWQRVLKDVESWADIAIRLQSPIIFRESMIRLVGLWNVNGAINKPLIASLDQGRTIMDIVEKKIHEQTYRKIEIEERLRTFFPANMLHPANNPANAIAPGRSVYANDLYMWQALTLVRQFIVSEIMAGHGYQAADGGASFYRKISTGDAAYCCDADLDQWHLKFDMTSKGKQRMREGLIYVKNQMKTVVAELMVSRTVISDGNGDYPYLTHTEFKDVELPWYRAPAFPSKQMAYTGEESDAEEEQDDPAALALPTLPVQSPNAVTPESSRAKGSPKSDDSIFSGINSDASSGFIIHNNATSLARESDMSSSPLKKRRIS